jgi:hypothetical protein
MDKYAENNHFAGPRRVALVKSSENRLTGAEAGRSFAQPVRPYMDIERARNEGKGG